MRSHHLATEYITAKAGEADRIFDFRASDNLKDHNHHVLVFETHTNKPLVWAVPNLLTNEEHGRVMEQLNRYQSSVAFQCLQVEDIFGEGVQDLSKELLPRLQHDYNRQQARRQQNGGKKDDQIHSIAPNWRVIKLQDDQEFPAHREGMTSHHEDSVFAVSTHSILLEFVKEMGVSSLRRKYEDEEASTDSSTKDSSVASTEDEVGDSNSKGGAIRFYYRQNPWDGPYDYCVDVHLPPGWAVVMEQRPDLWYALQPSRMESSVRFVAQARLLQAFCPGEDTTTTSLMTCGKRGAFALGPGLLELFEKEAESCLGQPAPQGWGLHGIHPRSTLWKAGRPIIRMNHDLLLPPSQQQQLQPQQPIDKRWSVLDDINLDQLLETTSPPHRPHQHCKSFQQNDEDLMIRKQIPHCESGFDDSSVTFDVDFSESNPSTRTEEDLVGGVPTRRSSSSFVSVEDPTMEEIRLAEKLIAEQRIAAQRLLEDRRRQQKQEEKFGSNIISERRIQVTRKPRRDSLVGRMMETFERK